MRRARRCAWAMLAGLAALTGSNASAGKASESYWELLSRLGGPERERIREPFRFERTYGSTDVPGMEYFFCRDRDRIQVVGFVLKNRGSQRINPAGMEGRKSFREYCFLYPDRARENIHLIITDDVAISGRYSQDNMFREWHFFPRRYLPALEVSKPDNRAVVTLPTGETVAYDLDTKEVVAGVLRERALDMTRSRHARSNPRVTYQGDYLAVTVAQRGESARRARVWGRRKMARVHYPAKYPRPCEISPRHLWDQNPDPGDSDPRLTMLHTSDQAVFDVIERQCRWDLAELRRLASAPVAPAPREPEATAGLPPPDGAERDRLARRIAAGELTVEQVAERYGRSADEVRGWVRAASPVRPAKPVGDGGGMFEH